MSRSWADRSPLGRVLLGVLGMAVIFYAVPISTQQSAGRAVVAVLITLLGIAALAWAIVGLGGQVFMAESEAEAKRFFRPYFDNAPVYGHGPSLEDFSEMTPLTVGTPEQVIERTLGFADYAGDYQRQMFLMDHAGLPTEVVLEQIEILGREVVPVLRREFERRRPAHVPSDPPTHASLVAAGPESPHHQVAPARVTETVGSAS